MNFPETKLSDVIDEISMGPFGSNIKVECFQETGIPVLNGSNLMGFKLGEESFRYVSEEKADSLGKANASKGDVVITHRGTLGQIIYIPQDSKYDRYVISQSQFRIRFNKQKALPEYIVYYFHTTEGQHRLLMNASQVGVPALARPSTSFPKVSIPLPPLPTQQRIASILSSLDAKIENNNKINAKLEEIAQNLFKEWFVDFGPFKNGKFVESELGLIPEGWRVGKLSEIGKIVGGSTPSKNNPEFYTTNGIAWITPKDLSITKAKFTSRGEIDITEAGYKSTSTKLMPKGSVLFSSRAPIGYLTIAKNDICTNQGFKSVVPTTAGTGFIYYLLKYLTPDIENKAVGTTFKEASGSLMSSLGVIIPTKEILDDFESILDPIFEKQELLESESTKLTTIRDILLPKLMSGEIEV